MDDNGNVNRDQSPTPLAYGLKGVLLGEMLMLGDETHSAEVTAMEDCGLIDLNPDQDPNMQLFVDFARSSHHNVWKEVAYNLAEKLRRNGISQGTLSELTVPKRLARLLLQLLNERPADSDPNKIGTKLDVKTLSTDCSASRETVTDAISNLTKARVGQSPIIEYDNGFITVLDREALENAGRRTVRTRKPHTSAQP